MGETNLRYVLGLIAAVTLALGVAPAAQASITSAIDCCTFDEGPFTQEAGVTATYSNPADSDGAPHNVTSTAKGPDGKSLFESETIFAGKSASVDGTQYLSPGTYPFFCSIHGPSMSGDIVVSGGNAVPRPKLKLSLPGQKIKQVRRSGKLKVKVKAVTPSSGIRVTVSKGKKKLGKASGLTIKKGTRTVKVKLTKAGRKAIKRGKVVKFTVKATVAYGKSAVTARKLR